MNGKQSKKLRREYRKALRSQTKPELRWFARPLVLKAWTMPAAFVVRQAVRLGWRSLGFRWLRFVASIPERGVRFVVVRSEA